jgi:hypothetical protein
LSADGSRREAVQSSIASNASFLDTTRLNTRIAINVSVVENQVTPNINAKKRRRMHLNSLTKN